MLCLRRVAIRALQLPSKPIAARLRPITTLTSSITRLSKQPQLLSPLQRRFVSGEATQGEHDENATTRETVKSADEEGSSSVASAIKSVPETMYNKASNAADSVSESVRGAAQDALGTGAESDLSQSTSVFAGNLYFQITNEDFAKRFESIGPVKSTRIIKDPFGRSKGFGYVEFEDHATAQRAVDTLDQQDYDGRLMNVQISKPRGPQNSINRSFKNEPTKTLFIGNMPFDMSDRDLNNLFSKMKNIVDVRIAIDRRTGQPRGFAHADFVDEQSATQGLEILKNLEIAGRVLRVDYSTSTSAKTTGTGP